jgi:hypothetical protein
MSEQDNPLLINAALLAPSVTEPTLQRKCACGNHTISGAECESCKKEKTSGTLQRTETSPAEVASVPPIVHEVLDSPGQPLDQESRSFFEPRFGRDFSRVRVHTDAKADDSAKAVNAKAYTVGQNLVFQDGQFTPGSSSGKQLLAHELAHVAQQSGAAAQSTSGLRVDAAGSPAERQADAASEAALRGSGPANIAAAPTMISRTPDEPAKKDPFKIDPSVIFAPAPVEPYTITKKEPINEDQVRVFINTGKRYLITRKRRKEVEVTEGRRKPHLSTKPGIDRQNVWLDINFCQGATEGTVKIGADIPDQVVQAIISNVMSGGDIDAAVRNMKFTPFAEANVQIRNWKISAKAQTTVDTEGKVQGAEGSVKVDTDTPAGRVGGKIGVGSQKVGDDPLGGLTVTIGIEWTPGAEPRKIPDCRPRNVRVVEYISYRCDEEATVPARDVPRTREVTKEDKRDLYLYFQYATPRLDSQRSAAPLSELRGLLGEGYRVTLVEGYTSPEGPEGSAEDVKAGQYKRGKYHFKHNRQLSQDRAEAAVREVERLCSDASGSCFATPASPTQKGELYQLRELGKEVEGPKQADEAAKEFKKADAEAPHRTPDVERRLDRARTPQERADIVYPLLRRALIKLSRSRKETEHYTEHIPEGTSTREVIPCPEKLKNAAFPDPESGKVGPRR